MRTRFTSTLLLSTAATFALAAAGAAAFADEAGAISTSSSSKMRASAQIEMLPVGDIEIGADGDTQSEDAAFAYGISAAFDYALTPYLSVGVSPRLVLNVLPDSDDVDEDEAGKQLDLRARVLAHMPVAPKLEVYGYLSPGYSIAMFDEEDLDDPTGFSLGGALGATYDVAPAMYLTGEVGYTKAFTSTDLMIGGQSFETDLDLSYLHVGLGAGTRF